MEPKQIGRYEIQRRLGKGGMGSLYLARDPGLDRLVAIKLLKEDYLDDQEFRERFAREARALARLRHPNIVVVFDFGEHEDRPFMAMEYIDGETLRQRLMRTPPLKLALGLAIVEDLCAGLASAHDAGIVHRDIKPDNIMMDRQGVLKLLDFGIARNAHAESTHQMTQPGMIMGTYNYMSPEQLLGEMVDKRSDIFAVGAVLYQVIAREQAFPGAFGAVYHRVLTAGPVPLKERVPDVDPTLVRIVMRALERDPSDRFQDANEMRLELSRARRHLAERGGAADEGHETIVVPRIPSSRRQKDSEAKRGLIAEQLRLGHEAFARGDYDIAIQYGERASFVDPDNAAAIELVNKSRVAIDSKSVLPLLQQASELLSQNRFQEALTKAEEASAAVPDLSEAEALRNHVQAVLDRIRSAQVRESRINTSLERARHYLDRGEYDTALRAVYEVLALDPDRQQARAIEQQAKARLQAQREHEKARRDAYDRLDAARALADHGEFEKATAALNAIAPQSDTVRSAVADAIARLDRMQRQARADAAVADARVSLAGGDFAGAVAIIEAIPTDDLTAEALEVKANALETLAHRRELEEKQHRLEQLIASADTLIDAGDVTRARGRLDEAAGLGLADQRLDRLQRRLEALIARVESQRRKQALDREAAETIERARQLFATDAQASITFLERSGSAHPDVLITLEELRGRLVQIEERATRERERQLEEARRAEEERRAEEARKAEEHEARAQVDGQLDELKGDSFSDPFSETIVRPTIIEEREKTRITRREQRERPVREEPRKRPEAMERPHPVWWSWRDSSPAARATIALLAVIFAAAIGVGTFRVLVNPSTNSTAVNVVPSSSTGPEKVQDPAPPVVTEKPIDVPQQATPDVPSVEARGTIVLDALPWAEVVSIVDAQGNRREIPANSYTPLTLTLPVGDYEVTFRNGSTRTAKVRIPNDGVSRIEPIDFGKVDAAEYFQRQGWP